MTISSSTLSESERDQTFILQSVLKCHPMPLSSMLWKWAQNRIPSLSKTIFFNHKKKIVWNDSWLHWVKLGLITMLNFSVLNEMKIKSLKLNCIGLSYGPKILVIVKIHIFFCFGAISILFFIRIFGLLM